MSSFSDSELFIIWIFALPELASASLPMPLGCGVLSVYRWLSPVTFSWCQGHTTGDEHEEQLISEAVTCGEAESLHNL